MAARRGSLLFLAVSSNMLSRLVVVAAAAGATNRNAAFVALTSPYYHTTVEGGRSRYHAWSGSSSRISFIAKDSNSNHFHDSHKYNDDDNNCNSNGSYKERPEGDESVTGLIYSEYDSKTDESVDNSLTVTLFTKKGCTLCDKVVDILQSVRREQPHTLLAVDITDPDKGTWYQKYKYDIPILHVNGKYWAKHRLTKEQALLDLEAVRKGSFLENIGEEPDAGAMEKRQAERLSGRKK
jgi:hypothetical protein